MFKVHSHSMSAPNSLPDPAQPSLGKDILAPTLRFVLWLAAAMTTGFTLGIPFDMVRRPYVGIVVALSLAGVTYASIRLEERGHRQAAAGLLFTYIWVIVTASMVAAGNAMQPMMRSGSIAPAMAPFGSTVRTILFS